MMSYTIRYSVKAKYLQLRLSSIGLEVVVPSTQVFTTEYIETFIQKKQPWITKHAKFPTIPDLKSLLPKTIYLEALSKQWKVNYIATEHKRLKLLANSEHDIFLIGNITDEHNSLYLLKDWLKSTAKSILPEWLTKISLETGLSFADVQVRFNMTRWGSCTNKKKINLSCKLLFLPPILVRHVLLHELCHTRIMNHGPKFWALMLKLDPQAKALAKQLKIIAQTLPTWVNLAI